jgi:hypothetical protein
MQGCQGELLLPDIPGHSLYRYRTVISKSNPLINWLLTGIKKGILLAVSGV